MDGNWSQTTCHVREPREGEMDTDRSPELMVSPAPSHSTGLARQAPLLSKGPDLKAAPLDSLSSAPLEMNSSSDRLNTQEACRGRDLAEKYTAGLDPRTPD